uniref:Uncharacterized protein n=1 Tax=Arundo donax TaxID=35708 RepID=A0A0A9ENT8_ARUDO
MNSMTAKFLFVFIQILFFCPLPLEFGS